MIAVITPPPSEANTWKNQLRLWVRTGTYSAGLVASTTTVGAIAGTIGSSLHVTTLNKAANLYLWVAGTAIVALAYSMHELGFIRLPVPQVPWQVPAQWLRYGAYGQALLYGLVLGADIFTFMPHATFYVLLLLEATLGLKGGATLGVIYGFARLTPTWAAILYAHYGRRGCVPVTTWIAWARKGLFHIANGIALAIIGEVLIGLLLMVHFT